MRRLARLVATLVLLAAFAAFAAVGASAAAPRAAAAQPLLQVLVEPHAGMVPIDRLVAGARRSVDVEIYELSDPTFEEILVRDAERGVAVRVILDKAYVEDENVPAYDYLSAHHVLVRWAPKRFDLDHEKAIVVDDATALVMTMNLTARYYSTTRDFVVVDRQAADARAIETTVEDDWSASGAVAPRGVDLLWSPGSEEALIGLIGSARQTVAIENEEMDDRYITNALVGAARRGVRVTVVMTAGSSWDAAFRELAAAGVHVITYPDTETGLYIHAKAVVVDAGQSDERAFVGSENFSVASLVYNRELGIVTRNPSVVSTLGSVLAGDASRGTPWR